MKRVITFKMGISISWFEAGTGEMMETYVNAKLYIISGDGTVEEVKDVEDGRETVIISKPDPDTNGSKYPLADGNGVF